jgi:hypothetical protein
MPKAVKLWQTALSKLQQLPSELQQAGSDARDCGFFATSLTEMLSTVAEFLHSDRVSSAQEAPQSGSSW